MRGGIWLIKLIYSWTWWFPMSSSIQKGDILKGNSQSVLYQNIHVVFCSALRCCPVCTAHLYCCGTGLCRAGREPPGHWLQSQNASTKKVTTSSPVSLTAVLFLFKPSFSAARICPRNWGADIQVEEVGYGPAPSRHLHLSPHCRAAECWVKAQVMRTDALALQVGSQFFPVPSHSWCWLVKS